MYIKKKQGISFEANSNILGPIPENIKIKLINVLNNCGSDHFIHDVFIKGDVALITTSYKTVGRSLNVGSSEVIKRLTDEDSSKFIMNLADTARGLVNYFYKTTRLS